MDGWMEGETQMRKSLRLFRRPRLQLLSGLLPPVALLLRRDMSWHQKCCYKAHTNTHTHAQIIFTSYAPLPLRRRKLITLKIESSYADSESCVHVRSGDAHVLRRKHTRKQENISLRETQTPAAHDQKLLIPLTHTHRHTHIHIFLFSRWKAPN